MPTTHPNSHKIVPVNGQLSVSQDLKEVYQYTGKLASFALAAKARRGEPTGCAPTGYTNLRTPDESQIETDPKLGPLVREAFELAAQGCSLRAILAELTPKGLVSRNGKPMGPSALRNILTNPFYIGLIRYQGRIYPGKHRPLISQSIFKRILSRLQKVRTKIHGH